jgi:hypothetical protein
MMLFGGGFLLSLAFFGQPAMAVLEGPSSSPPFGVLVEDTDPGDPDNKEQWGRAGGRTFSFTVYNSSEYLQLKWRATYVALAFDGEVTDGTSEIMAYDSDDSGVAMWTGQTQVKVLNETTGVYEEHTVGTKFRLTVTDDAAALVPYTVMPDGLPLFDLEDLTPNASGEVLFNANLQMMAQMPLHGSTTAICNITSPTVGNYYPALDVFDCLQTDPADIRPAISDFEHGFFYEVSAFSLGDHDEHIAGLIDALQGTTDEIWTWSGFLYDEVPARLVGVDGRLLDLSSQLTNVGGDVIGAVDGVSLTLGGIGSDIDYLRERVDGIHSTTLGLPPMWLMLYLFGLEEWAALAGIEIPEGVPPLDDVIGLSQWYQKIADIESKVDNLQTALGAAAKLDIQVKDFQSEGGKGKETVPTKRFIVLLTENGNPVDGDITSISAIVDGGSTSMEPIGDYTAVQIGTGIYEMAVPLAGPLAGIKILFIQASYNGNPGTINGSKLFTVGLHTE